jgi:hypothetical protein
MKSTLSANTKSCKPTVLKARDMADYSYAAVGKAYPQDLHQAAA